MTANDKCIIEQTSQTFYKTHVTCRLELSLLPAVQA